MSGSICLTLNVVFDPVNIFGDGFWGETKTTQRGGQPHKVCFLKNCYCAKRLSGSRSSFSSFLMSPLNRAEMSAATASPAAGFFCCCWGVQCPQENCFLSSHRCPGWRLVWAICTPKHRCTRGWNAEPRLVKEGCVHGHRRPIRSACLFLSHRGQTRWWETETSAGGVELLKAAVHLDRGSVCALGRRPSQRGGGGGEFPKTQEEVSYSGFSRCLWIHHHLWHRYKNRGMEEFLVHNSK